MNTEESIHNWLIALQNAVRAVDYDHAEQTLFAPDVVSFGTYVDMAQGVATARAEQWANIWPTIQDFTFRLDQLFWGAQGDLAWAACPWESTGFNDDGSSFHRPGRMTIILQKRGEAWRAIHTHFSLYPKPAPASVS